MECRCVPVECTLSVFSDHGFYAELAGRKTGMFLLLLNSSKMRQIDDHDDKIHGGMK